MSSEIKVSSIKAKDGTAGISIANSTGNITLNNPITTGTFNGTIGTSASISSSFGATDRSSIFVTQTGWTVNDIKAYSFNGFMFFTSNFQHNGGLPTTGESIWVIESGNSTYRPSFQVDFPIVSYEGDSASAIRFSTDGNVTCQYPKEGGSNTNWYAVINGWYKFA